MTKSVFRTRRLTAATAIAIAVALAGCGKSNPTDSQMTTTALPDLPATLPLDASAPADWPAAPQPAALPAPPAPIRTVRVSDPGDYYGYADAAWDYQNALGDSPPDYYFDYDGTDPWAWEGYDQSVVFLEPLDDGYRYYYYRPGADQPYFVRDPYYGYGYDGGSLAVVYDNFGEVVPYGDYGPRRDYAARYLVRGRDLYASSRRNQRQGVSAAAWAARAPQIASTRAVWEGLRERQPAWRAFHNRVASRQTSYWREESSRRQTDARRFAAWRGDNFRSAAPPRAIPAAWTRANWARDQKRFLPARAERPQVANNEQPRRTLTPQGLAGDRQPDRRGEMRAPGNQPPAPAAIDPRRAAIAGRSGRGSPATGPMRAIREPQANVPIARPQFRSGGQPGNALRGRPQTQRQPQVTAPRAQAPAQPRFGGGRPQASAPRAQPAPQVAPQRAPRPQMARPAAQPRPPQAMRPAPQPRALKVSAPQPAPVARSGGGKAGKAGNDGGGRRDGRR